MNSTAIFLLLTFLAGFQAAVLSEEPHPSIVEPNLSTAEHRRDWLGEWTSHLGNEVKKYANTAVVLTTEALNDGKEKIKKSVQKYTDLQLKNVCKEAVQGGQSMLNKGKEMINDQYKKAVEMLVDMKNHHALEKVKENVVNPILDQASKAVIWLGDQSLSSICSSLTKIPKKMGINTTALRAWK